MCKKVWGQIKEYDEYVKMDLSERERTKEYKELGGLIGKTNPKYTMAQKYNIWKDTDTYGASLFNFKT